MDRSISRSPSPKNPLFDAPYQTFCARRKIRALSVACYFGFAPFLWIAEGGRRKNKHVQYHLSHSLVLSLLIFFIVVATAITDTLGYLYSISIWSPSPKNLFELSWLIRLFDYTGNVFFLIWSLSWIYCVNNALRAKSPRIPILSRIAQNKPLMRLSFSWTVFTRLALILLILVAVHGTSLSMNPSSSPQVYILYTVGGYIPTEPFLTTFTPPRWTFSLFFYPIISAATLHWGHGSVVIEPLSDVTFKKSIQNGRFVFVASHGGKDAGSFTYSYSPYRGFSPSDLQPGDAGPQLRYVYFAACFAGYRGSDWRQALAPADVQTYARISYVEEHFLWVWLKATKVIFNMN